MQRVVPETSKLFVRLCSSGQRCDKFKGMCLPPISWIVGSALGTSSHAVVHYVIHHSGL